MVDRLVEDESLRSLLRIPEEMIPGTQVGLGWVGWVGLVGLGWLGWAGWVGLVGLGWVGWAGWVGWVGLVGLGEPSAASLFCEFSVIQPVLQGC